MPYRNEYDPNYNNQIKVANQNIEVKAEEADDDEPVYDDQFPQCPFWSYRQDIDTQYPMPRRRRRRRRMMFFHRPHMYYVIHHHYYHR